MKEKFHKLIDAAVSEFEKSGIEYKKNTNLVDLDEIIQKYANPQSEFKNGYQTSN
jgi:hypothetical protein